MSLELSHCFQLSSMHSILLVVLSVEKVLPLLLRSTALLITSLLSSSVKNIRSSSDQNAWNLVDLSTKGEKAMKVTLRWLHKKV